MYKTLTPRLIPALIAIAFASSASAAGFKLQNQSGSGNGNAFAGAAAAAEDASTVYFNPAGMSYLPRGQNISLSGTIIKRSIDFTNQGSTTVNSTLFPLPQGNGGDGGGIAFLPHGYWVWGINQNLSVGLGMGPTFGSRTEYDFDFVGRNAGYFFELQQFNINPSVAWKFNEQFSLGFGLNLAHNESHFKQGVPLVDPAGLTTGGIPFAANNYLDVKGDAWALGYNLGATWQILPSTRLGVAYRSALKFDLEGEQKYNSPNARLVNQDIKALLKTPAVASIALSHKATDRLELLTDATWTQWSVINTIDLKSSATGADLNQLSYRFKDSWRFGVGANYQMTNDLKLRFGVAYDNTPVRSNADRTMTLPDSDRTWLSLGAKYNLSKTMSIDVGYSHIFFDEAKTERAVTTGYPGVQTTRQTIRGEFKTTADIFSAQLNLQF